jgi:hypothetical protein
MEGAKQDHFLGKHAKWRESLFDLGTMYSLTLALESMEKEHKQAESRPAAECKILLFPCKSSKRSRMPQAAQQLLRLCVVAELTYSGVYIRYRMVYHGVLFCSY